MFEASQHPAREGLSPSNARRKPGLRERAATSLKPPELNDLLFTLRCARPCSQCYQPLFTSLCFSFFTFNRN